MAEAQTLLRILEFVALLIPAVAIMTQVIYRIVINQRETVSKVGILVLVFTAVSFVMLIVAGYETIDVLTTTLPTDPYGEILDNLSAGMTYFVLAVSLLLYEGYRVGSMSKIDMDEEPQRSLDEYRDD